MNFSKHNRVGKTLGATLVGVALLVTAACGGSSSNAASDDELVWGKRNDVAVLDPTVNATAEDWQVLDQAYETLVGLDENLKPVPKLAESWEQVSPTEYVFKIRSDVKFSDGRPLTVDDIVGSLDRMMDPEVGAFWASFTNQIASVEAISETEVRIELKGPQTALVPALSGVPSAILPMKELEDGSFDPESEIRGTGPWMVVDHTPDVSWTLEPNPHYWGDAPKASKFTIKILPDDSARVAALRSGTVDLATFAAPDAIKLLEDADNVETIVQAATDYYRLDVNAISSPFEDPRLREALALAIDRDKIVRVALGGVGEATGAVPVGFEGACAPGDLPYAKQDLTRATQLVEEAGATGKTVDILSISSYPEFGAISQVLQADLNQIGLKATVTQQDQGSVYERVYSGTAAPADFDLNIGYHAGYSDPAMVLSLWNPSNSPYFAGFLKSNDDLNGVISQANALDAKDPAREKALSEACKLIATEANQIPVVTRPQIVAYRSDQVDPSIASLEAYGNPMRNSASFAMKGR